MSRAEDVGVASARRARINALSGTDVARGATPAAVALISAARALRHPFMPAFQPLPYPPCLPIDAPCLERKRGFSTTSATFCCSGDRAA